MPTREEYLAEKCAGIWLRRVEEVRLQPRYQKLSGENWLRLLLFAPSSKAVRETICGILENICKVVNLFIAFLMMYFESHF